ncbi:alanine racemase [Deinococcus sp. KNUC1210]|uniref:alanine racemase n=1 Tax=Deinococcus sp. KNUC1210 TaxID=2917691 RepID=UPI001EF10C7F|nr:alanine racemase [Deinococcus sp. KNUC1210]ULH15893.1 alanine racemase [Deinococcus sp. KNUC1210]
MQPRSRAVLSASALVHNLRELHTRAGVPLLLPVKADAYGHGLAQVVQATRDLPEVWGYAVAMPLEAAELAALHPDKPVLLLTPAAPDEMQELSDLGVLLQVGTQEEVDALPGTARVHLKVDTGMNRLGAKPDEALRLGHLLAERGQLSGVYTHLASADDPDLSSARRQLEQFARVQAQFPDVLAHAANGAGVLSFGPLPGMSLARPGLASYGYAPDHLRDVLPLRPVMTLSARVGAVHTVQAGEQVSYGGLWTAPHDTQAATVQLGYADGYPRSATGHAHLWVQGERRAVLGRICMDQFMLDVTGLDVQAGDWLEVWGEHSVHPREVAAWGGLAEYELLTGVGRRVQRMLNSEG